MEEENINGKYYIPVVNAVELDPHVAAHVNNATLTSALWELSDELVAKWCVSCSLEGAARA